ncbi:MAG: sodium:solute symporter [Bryobacteraceae bacterium]
MRTLDWAVLGCSLVFIVAYGLWKSRQTTTTHQYLLAGKSMPWYAMALSIMATQASAITFISTTGQAYADGMRFVQFYFGLPLAMIVISATAVPIFHRANVYTAYEYLEQRFDAKTRALVSAIFLIQRGLAVGVALYAPALVLTVILGWPDQWTTAIMGAIVVAYTTFGGIKAVTWTDFQQMLIMFAGLFISLGMAVWHLPADVGLIDALRLAGASGKLNAVVTSFDWNDRYNVWNGLLGGMFLALAYFGCDQSQVQRYLTGRSIAQSRISLLFNAVAKIPMQFFILLIGALVFVFYVFEKPPVTFHPGELARIESQGAYGQAARSYDAAFEARRTAAREYLAGRAGTTEWKASLDRFEKARADTRAIAPGDANDTNYVFLAFVIRYLPVGVVGLILAAILAAAMSTISAEVNSLATVSTIDIYQRFLRRGASDGHYLNASRIATVFWGSYAVITARYGAGLGSLIEAVNMLGSLFYGGLLGVFVLAFAFPRVGGTAAFVAVLAGEAAIFAAKIFTGISFLWYNVIGAVVVVATGLALAGASASAHPDRGTPG